MSIRAASCWVVPLLLAFVFLMLALGTCTQEDAFISFRYADHLIQGHGLVYNAGERVEGYSNFLWTLMLAGGMALGSDPVPLSRLLGMGAAIVLFLVVWRLAARANPEGGGVLAAAVVGASTAIASEAVQGLETVPFALMVVLGVCWIAAGRPAVGALVLAACAMTRPEGLGVFGLALCGRMMWNRTRNTRLAGRTEWTAIAAFAALYVPYWSWRFSYYGYPFPNTFYAKTGGGGSQLLRGIGYEADFAIRHPVLVLLCLLAVVATVRRRSDRPWRDDAFWIVGPVVIAGYAGYVVAVGGDFKDTFRFVIPFIPLLALGIDRGLRGQLAGHLRVAVALLALLVNGAYQVPGALDWAAERSWDLECRRAAGRWLHEHARPGATLAIHSAGIIPYYSRLPTIDMWGLNDLHIAHRKMPQMGQGLAGHEKHDARYVFEQEPTYYVDEYRNYVTPEPVRKLLSQVKSNLPDAHVEGYRARSVPLRVSYQGDRLRWWFNFLERSPAREP